MVRRTLPPQAYLRECFDYDPDTGVLRWRHRPQEHFATTRTWKAWNTAFAGRECKTAATRGYLHVVINRQLYLVHRVIWRWMTDDDPETVDHRNHQTNDNRWDNIRAATRAENTRHCSGHRDRKYPDALKGAYRHKAGWLAMIGYGGKQHYLGCFKTEAEAHRAYCEAGEMLHKEFRKSN